MFGGLLPLFAKGVSMLYIAFFALIAILCININISKEE